MQLIGFRSNISEAIAQLNKIEAGYKHPDESFALPELFIYDPSKMSIADQIEQRGKKIIGMQELYTGVNLPLKYLMTT